MVGLDNPWLVAIGGGLLLLLAERIVAHYSARVQAWVVRNAWVQTTLISLVVASAVGLAFGSGVPSGGVTAFDPAEGCPAGWKPYEKVRGHVIIGAGQGTGTDGEPLTNRVSGDQGGSESHRIALQELPSHVHNGATLETQLRTHVVLLFANFPRGGGWQTMGSPGALAQNALSLLDHTHRFQTDGGEGLTGDPTPDNNMPPWVALEFCKKD